MTLVSKITSSARQTNVKRMRSVSDATKTRDDVYGNMVLNTYDQHIKNTNGIFLSSCAEDRRQAEGKKAQTEWSRGKVEDKAVLSLDTMIKSRQSESRDVAKYLLIGH